MNGLDIAIVCILGFTLIRGIMTGLMQSISGFIGAIAGFYTAYYYYPMLAQELSRWVNNDTAVNILSFFIIFCAVLLIVTLLGKLLKWIMKIAFLGWVDRLGGALIGLLKGGIVVGVIVIVLTTFLPSGSPLLKGSRVLPYFSVVSETMMESLPKEAAGNGFKPKMKELKRIWKNTEEIIKSGIQKKI